MVRGCHSVMKDCQEFFLNPIAQGCFKWKGKKGLRHLSNIFSAPEFSWSEFYVIIYL